MPGQSQAITIRPEYTSLLHLMPNQPVFLEKLKYNAANALTEETLPSSALNYIWANKLLVDEIVNNLFVEQTKMIAVQSGHSQLGQ